MTNTLPEGPMHKLLVCFILDTIKELPQEQTNLIKSMNLKKVFKSELNDWRLIIKHTLNLSNTIEIAIKDLWLKNSKTAFESNDKVDANQFTILFIENYYKENSKVDVWLNESDLIQAKKRISESYLAE